MAQIIRPKCPGASIFFTVCLSKQNRIKLTDHIVHLRSSVRAVRTLWPFEIRAWVVLPDHMHAIWTLPDGDSDYALRWASIKARFSRGLPAADLHATQASRREKGIWQRRYWEHHVRGIEDFAVHQRLCWADPVRHGLVNDPQDWPYSSFHRDAADGAAVDRWRGPWPRFPTGDPWETMNNGSVRFSARPLAIPNPSAAQNAGAACFVEDTGLTR